MITQSNTVEIGTNEGKLAYLAARVRELIPDHPLLSKITVALYEYPGSPAALFSDGKSYFEVNIPPALFDNLASLDMVLAHELGHVGQKCEPDALHRFASKYHHKHVVSSKVALYLTFLCGMLGGADAAREAEADIRAVKCLRPQGYRPEDYHRFLDDVIASITSIKKRRYRWPRLISARRRVELVGRFIRQVTSSRL